MKKLNGYVISDKMPKMAVVVVESAWRHPLYKKTVKRSKKFLVQNDLAAKTGDSVVIAETRPLSARKRFTITEVIKK